MVYLHLFENENDFNNERNNNYIEPWVSATNTGNNTYRTDYNINKKEIPLTFEVTSDGNICWKAYDTASTKTIEYRKNSGEWTEITSATGNGITISVVSGDIIQFKGDNATYTGGTYQGWGYPYTSFNGTTAGFKVKGNIMSLIDSNGFTTATTLYSSYTFYNFFFNCTGLTDASELILPATTLSPYCYYRMFYSCTSLTAAPELLATALAMDCYHSMFESCTGLTTAPSILPATALANHCYHGMFMGCTSLTTAPELPATTLVDACYYYMLNNCTNLKYIKCLATDISASNCTSNWTYNIQASGTFVKAASMTSWSTGANGIPSNWTVQDAS